MTSALNMTPEEAAAYALAYRLLPEGWTLRLSQQDPPGDPWAAVASAPVGTNIATPGGIAYHGGATKAEALLQLAEVLRRKRSSGTLGEAVLARARRFRDAWDGKSPIAVRNGAGSTLTVELLTRDDLADLIAMAARPESES